MADHLGVPMLGAEPVTTISEPGTTVSDPSTSVSAFTQEVFGHMARADQRRWAQAYLQGLLMTPGRKSMRRLAATVSGSRTAAMSLHQFVNASPWEWGPARRELLRLTERHSTAIAWTVGTVILPKRGDHSCGVHRRFVPTAGRTINCQVGIGAFVASQADAIPVDWSLLLPEQWTQDARMRSRARIPDSLDFRPMWAQILHLVDTMASRTSGPRLPVVAELSDPADVGPLLHGLSTRGQEFVIRVPAALRVLGAPAPGRMRGTDSGQQARPARDFVGRNGLLPQRLAGADGQRRQVPFLSQPVRLPGLGHTYRLFSLWRHTGDSPSQVWITNLTGHSIDRLAGLARLLSRTATAVDSLERDFGLLDFEGRSFPGWHHHVTLASAAYAYSRLSPDAAADDAWFDLRV
ncbi:IS701 family transposase [Streptomyces sp. NPDC059009]|uniref:IS701 family transposase n=1 Tax=Streptomyces sp. NPDC059009 TaxID=3346694 RepID=UPI0036756B47